MGETSGHVTSSLEGGSQVCKILYSTSSNSLTPISAMPDLFKCGYPSMNGHERAEAGREPLKVVAGNLARIVIVARFCGPHY